MGIVAVAVVIAVAMGLFWVLRHRGSARGIGAFRSGSDPVLFQSVDERDDADDGPETGDSDSADGNGHADNGGDRRGNTSER